MYEMENILAQVETTIGQPINGFGDLGNPGGNAPSIFARFLSVTIGLITVIAFIWFLILIMTGAIAVMSAGGDKVKLENARSRLTSGFIGVVIVVAGVFILQLIAGFLGLPGILNIEDIVTNLSP